MMVQAEKSAGFFPIWAWTQSSKRNQKSQPDTKTEVRAMKSGPVWSTDSTASSMRSETVCNYWSADLNLVLATS